MIAADSKGNRNRGMLVTQKIVAHEKHRDAMLDFALADEKPSSS